MKLAHYAIVLLVSGCATDSYTYLERVPSGTPIHRSLYSVAVPQNSPKDTRRWERYSKDEKPEDLVLKYSEGLVLPSYAATIQVKRGVRLLGNVSELKSYVAQNSEYKSPTDFSKEQPHLLCVRSAVLIDAAPEKAQGFFQHTLACIDSKTHNYYELNVSYMTKRKGEIPPDALITLADHFFTTFRVEE